MNRLFISTAVAALLLGGTAQANGNNSDVDIGNGSDLNIVSHQQDGNDSTAETLIQNDADSNNVDVRQEAGTKDNKSINRIFNGDNNDVDIRQIDGTRDGRAVVEITGESSDRNNVDIIQSNVRNGVDIKASDVPTDGTIPSDADGSVTGMPPTKQLVGLFGDATIDIKNGADNTTRIQQANLRGSGAAIEVNGGNSNDVRSRQIGGQNLKSIQLVALGNRNELNSFQTGRDHVSFMAVDNGNANVISHSQTGVGNTAATNVSFGNGNTVTVSQN